MNNNKLCVPVVVFFMVFAGELRSLGQVASAGEVQALREQVKVLKAELERSQAEQQRLIEAFQQRLEAMEKRATAGGGAGANGATPAVGASVPSTAGGGGSGSGSGSGLTQPMTVARSGSSYLNLSLEGGVVVGSSTVRDPSAQLNLGGHDPAQRGFSVPHLEMALDGAVDPYFKGAANILFTLDKENRAGVEVEEAYLESTSLPWNLQLKAGQMFAAFGRMNPQHPHAWAFLDQPVILNRAFGPDGFRNPGAQLSWMLPTPFFSEASLGVFNGAGESAWSFRNPGEDDGLGVRRWHGRATLDSGLSSAADLVYVPRLWSSFELTDTQTLVVGASSALGPNSSGPGERSEVYGLDAYWKWKPARSHEGFPFVSVQAEGLWARAHVGADPVAPGPLPAERLEDYGFYSQVVWGFRPHWTTGLRGEWAGGNRGVFDAQDPSRGERYRVSPDLTWYPSEFSRIRLQYNYDEGLYLGTAHSVWMEFQFMLGAHAAHKY